MSDKVAGLVQFMLVIAFIAGALIVSSLLGNKKQDYQQKQNADRVLIVQQVEVQPAAHRIEFETTGTVEARTEINVVPQVSGRVINVNDAFFAGGSFEAGEVLFEIEPKDFELEVRRLKAQVAQASTAYNLEKAESEAALLEWKTFNENKPAPALVARKPQLAEAWANLKAAKAQLEIAELNLERTKYTMPFAGRVLAGNLENGEFVTAGQSYGQVFDTATLEVQSSLENKKLEWLLGSEDGTITIKTNYLGNQREYEGYLKRGVSSLDTQTRFARVSFGFKDDASTLVPGIFADITITGSEQQGITKIPASAIQNDGNIWVISDDMTLRALTPDILFAGNGYVLTKSIDQSLNIVAGKLSGATEGTKVEVQENTDKEESED